jgi:hypothetical protein
MDTPKKRVWGEKRPKDRVTLQILLVFTLALTHPETFTSTLCKCECNTHTHTHDNNNNNMISENVQNLDV